MEREELRKAYFDWLYGLVYPMDGMMREEFRKTKLLWHMHQTPFYSSIELDSNRVSDGINLRYEFGYRHGYDDKTILIYLDSCQCSVLEVLVGLAVRCERQMMADFSYGDRTSQWFRKMIMSLGFGGMDNAHYDEAYVTDVLDRFLNHEYAPDGSGGLFALQHPTKDMRNEELWSQLCAYLNEYINNTTIQGEYRYG